MCDLALKGFPEAQDYFNQILSGINHVIKTHMNEMHSKFETQFSSMAGEVRRRDAIIAQLQLKLRSIEGKSTGSVASTSASSSALVLPLSRRQKREKMSQLSVDDDEPPEEDNSSSGSSAELLFMRGDSLDTVFTSSPPIQGGRRSISPGPSRHHAASANALNCPSSYYGGPGSLSSRHAQSHPSFYSGQGNGRSGRSSGYREWSGGADSLGSGSGSSSAVMVADVTGNLARLSDSVILDIGESSSSSSSSSKINIADVDDDEEEEENPAGRHPREEEDLDDDGSGGGGRSGSHNDWEVRMLAAEMERQERKRGHSLSDNLGDLKHCSTFLRRRRKFSDTETEFSETDMEEQLARSGSGSMDPSGSTVPSGSGGGGSTSTSAGHQSGSQRPRASSLDQFNLRYGIGRGIFKAMSIDRDKDKL